MITEQKIIDYRPQTGISTPYAGSVSLPQATELGTSLNSLGRSGNVTEMPVLRSRTRGFPLPVSEVNNDAGTIEPAQEGSAWVAPTTEDADSLQTQADATQKFIEKNEQGFDQSWQDGLTK